MSDDQSVASSNFSSATSKKSKKDKKEKSMDELLKQAAVDKKKMKVLKEEIRDSRTRQEESEK